MRTRLFPTLLGAGIGLAVNAVPAPAANDIEATAQLCAACHGQNGVPSDPKTVPIIWGQEPSYLFKQMRNYRNGERDNPIMSPIAKSLAEEDLRKIASYFAAKSWPAQSATATPRTAAQGHRPVPTMPSAEFSWWAAGAAPGGSQLRIPRHVDAQFCRQ
jgi:cytochrome c553